MLDEPRRRRPRWPGVVFVVVLLPLLAWNAYAAVRNNHDFPESEILRLRSRRIGTLLAANPQAVVKYTFAMYYKLRLLRGKTLVVPPRWAAHRFSLERVSRIHVEMTGEPFELPVQVTDRLFSRADLFWHADAGTVVEVFLDAAASRYVLVERSSAHQLPSEPDRLGLIMPEAMYRRERAALPTP